MRSLLQARQLRLNISMEECSPLPITNKYKELIIIDKLQKVYKAYNSDK